MKSLLSTAILILCVAHTGAFLCIWKRPYVDNHITRDDFGRKMNNVFKWDQKFGSLRQAREKAAEDNYALYRSTPEQANRQRQLEQDTKLKRKHMSAPANQR